MNDIRIAMSVPGRGRGLYLREYADVSKDFVDETVMIEPLFHDDAPNTKRIAFGRWYVFVLMDAINVGKNRASLTDILHYLVKMQT